MTEFDSEFAYRRCLELMNELEAEGARRLDGRQLARGVWSCRRKLLECHMYVQLNDCVLRGETLDNVIYNALDPYCNVRSQAPRSLSPIHRATAFDRLERGELPIGETSADYGPAPSRNASPNFDASEDERGDTDVILGNW